MSKPHRFGRLAVLLVILACSATAARAQSSTIHTGTLASGDSTLESGEYFDEYSIEASEGDEIIAVLTSFDFDPYLILFYPSGESFDNDDFGGSGDVSLIEVPVETAGTWKLRVTSYESGETGEYALMSGTREADGDDAGGPEGPEEFTVKDTIALGETVESTLDSEDPMRPVDDSHYEAYALEAEAGTSVVITMESSEFNAYLVLVSPTGEIQDSNEDAEEGTPDSRLEAFLAEGSRWLIVANSSEGGETGTYRLTVTEQEPEEFTSKDTIEVGETVEGSLGEDDPMRTIDDSYYEAYALEATPGMSVVITLESSDFDPYLVLVAPSGEIEQSNDDAEEGDLNSRLEATLEEGGRWLIVANTLEPEETGKYRLTVTHQ